MRLCIVLLLVRLFAADGKAYDFTCPAYPRLFDGLSVHGLPMVIDSRRRMAIKRGAAELKDGDLYEKGESLFITLNDTSGNADIVFETNCSSCTFRFGICPGKYRFIGSIASMNMPTDYSNFTVWGAYATTDGQIRVTPPISLLPRVPDPTMAPTFANPPTAAPTRVSAQRYSVLFEVEFDGIDRNVVLNNTDMISGTICSEMGFAEERCKIVAAIDDAAGDLAVSASLWSTVASIFKSAFNTGGYKHVWANRALLGTAKSIVTIIVDKFMYPEWQAPAINSISQYINRAGSGGFASDLIADPAIADLESTQVLQARKLNNSDASLFEHSCSLDGSLMLYWSMDTASPSRYVRGMLQMSGKRWVSGAAIASEVRTMVHDPNNVVFLYNAETDRSWIYALSSYRAKELEEPADYREFTRIVTVSKEAGKTSLQFEQQQNTGIAGDPVLNLDSPLGSNNFMWAYGDHFQQGHFPETRGITTVHWNQGTCTPVEISESLLPYLILGYGAAALLALVVLTTMSPWRHSKVAHFLKSNRVQWVTTRIKNKCRRYDHKKLQENEVKAVPKTQWLFDEILSTSIGAFLFTVLFSGVILAFGYFIYVDRMQNYRFDPIRCYSIALAYMGLVSMGISLVTATKTKLWQVLINVSIDRAMKFHKYASVSAMVFLMGHTGLQIWFWGVPLMINLDYTLVVGRARPLFGFVGMCCFMLVFVTSLPFYRNRLYHRFLGLHTWFLPGVVLSVLHYIDFGLLVLGPGLLLYFVDLFLRHLYSWLEPKVVARRLIGYEYIEMDIQFHNIFFFYEKNAVRLKSVSTQFLAPAAWYYVCVPEVKPNEWHPLTVVGFTANKIKFVVRRRNDGGWTENLYTRIFADLPVSVKMRGPYGSLRIDLYNPKYKDLVFIAGGVGAAVVQSMVEALIFYYTNYETENGFAPDIKLIIVSQNRSLYEFVNKRLEFYSTLKRPRITLDLYWTSKYMKYLQEDDKKDALATTGNLFSNKPSEKPFEIQTQSILKPAGGADEPAEIEAPADGYVSESYKALSTSPMIKNKPAEGTPAATPAISPAGKTESVKNATPVTKSTSTIAETPSDRSGISPASKKEKSTSGKKSKKLDDSDDNVRLNTDSVESVSMTPDTKDSFKTPTEKPSTSGKKSKKDKAAKKQEEDDDSFRLNAGDSVDNISGITVPSSEKASISSKKSKRKGAKKSNEDDDNFRLNADSLDEIATPVKTISPSKQSRSAKKASKKVNPDGDHGEIGDLNTDSVLSIEKEEVTTPPVNPGKKSKKSSASKKSRKGGEENVVVEEKEQCTDVSNFNDAHLYEGGSGGRKQPERLFTPSTKSRNRDDDMPPDLAEPSISIADNSSGAVVRETPMTEKIHSSKHITFGPVPEPPKSRIEDFIVYDHFYENILKRGRPNIEDIILNGINGEFSSGARGSYVPQTADEEGVFSNQAVIVCAPPSIIASARAVCSMYNIDMHDQPFDYN